MKRFSPEEDQFIKDNYLTSSLAEMGAILNRCEAVIWGRMKRLGISIPNELKSQRIKKGLSIGWHKGVETRFKKGLIPHNKGKKTSSEIKAKMAHTFYQKGHLPHNTLYDGAQRITAEGYIEERVSLGVWKHKHRLVWEQHNGPIPKGSVVKFKDGNRQNIAIENLYMVTRYQNMMDNTLHQYPEEIKEVIYSMSALSRQINKRKENE